MEGAEFLFFLFIRLLMAYGVACLGRKRTIGFGWAFFLGIIGSPVLSLIVVLCCKKKGTTFVDVTPQENSVQTENQSQQ